MTNGSRQLSGRSVLDRMALQRRLANIPAFKLHPLKGELNGYWSIWVNGNWRVTFRFVGVDVELVNYVDYH